MENLDKILSVLNSGEEMFGLRKDAEPVEPIESGCLSFDVATDIGGIPQGRLTIIYGPGGAGKTTLAMHIVSSALNAGKIVVYFDVESTFDEQYMKAIHGDNLDNFRLVQVPGTEKVLDVIEEIVDNAMADLVILDSIGAFSSEEERGKNASQKSIAQIARIMSPFLRRTVPKAFANNVTLLFLNQVRAAIGSYLTEYTFPGGNVLNHQSSLIVELAQSKKIKEGDIQIGHWVRATVKKNKVGRPGRTIKFPIIYGKGIDKYLDIVTLAVELGVLRRRGPYMFITLDGEETNVGSGITNVIGKLKEDEALMNEVVSRLKNLLITKGGMP